VIRDIAIEFEAPVRIESEMNRRDHWSARHKRFSAHKAAVAYPLRQRRDSLADLIHIGPCDSCCVGRLIHVTFTRLAPTRVDDDNLAGGFKACRDAVVVEQKLGGGSERFRWSYRQEKSPAYSSRVRIESRAQERSS